MPKTMATEVKKSGEPAKPDLIDKAADRSEKLDKIVSFAAKVLTGVFVALAAVYGWIADQVVVRPMAGIRFAIGILLVVGVGLGGLAYVKRARLGRWGSVGVAALGALAIGLTVTIWLKLPPQPAWQRINVPTLLAQQTPQDLGLALMLDQLAGRNGLIPGGETYKTLLQTRRAGEKVQEEWAGYFAPLLVANTMPSEISLKAVGAVSAANASIGAVVIVWTLTDDGPKIEPLSQEGFTDLRSSITLPVKLGPSQRAAILVFVYPLTAAASASLSEDIHQVLNVR